MVSWDRRASRAADMPVQWRRAAAGTVVILFLIAALREFLLLRPEKPQQRLGHRGRVRREPLYRRPNALGGGTVSYTHLTLPTICSV